MITDFKIFENYNSDFKDGDLIIYEWNNRIYIILDSEDTKHTKLMYIGDYHWSETIKWETYYNEIIIDNLNKYSKLNFKKVLHGIEKDNQVDILYKNITAEIIMHIRKLTGFDILKILKKYKKEEYIYNRNEKAKEFNL